MAVALFFICCASTRELYVSSLSEIKDFSKDESVKIIKIDTIPKERGRPVYLIHYIDLDKIK